MKSFSKLLIIAVALFSTVAMAGDTGTYKLTDYQVDLTPKSDGLVIIKYQQTWLVESGHIPWITVGVPNANYEVIGHGGAIKNISDGSSRSWSGVRLDLDQDYKPGQSFTVNFSIKQNKLFYADDTHYRIDFTPGWYDRAFIDHMQLAVNFFAPMDSVRADPPASRVSGQTMYWTKTKLGKGEQVSISVAFPKTRFGDNMAEENLKNSDGGKGLVIFFVILLIVFLVVIIVAINSDDSGGGYGGGSGYTGGSIFVGGGRSGGGRRSGGSGGFGGRSSSCACACVSCACACACAGGGGAGCSRKLDHSCPDCQKKE